MCERFIGVILINERYDLLMILLCMFSNTAVYFAKCSILKNIFTKMLKDIARDESPKEYRNKVQHACRQRQGIIACNNNNMPNPF